MKTFYTILSFNIKPEINERLSIALIMICGEKVFFRYSPYKLSIIQKLTNKETLKATQTYLKLIEEAVYSKKAFYSKADLLEIKAESKYDRLFSEQYIEYLSRYNNNLVSFTSPNFIELEGTDHLFDLLYYKFIGDFDNEKEQEQEQVKYIELLKKEFYPRVKPHFNIEKEITSTQFASLITSVKVDLMGKNEITVFGQSIDFEKKNNSIEYTVGNLLQIKRAFPDAKQFVIGFEPNKNLEVNHRIWENIRQISDFDYVDISEVERITEYAIEHGVTPLI